MWKFLKLLKRKREAKKDFKKIKRSNYRLRHTFQAGEKVNVMLRETLFSSAIVLNFKEVYYPRSGRILYYSVRLKNGVERNCKDGELEKRYNK